MGCGQSRPDVSTSPSNTHSTRNGDGRPRADTIDKEPQMVTTSQRTVNPSREQWKWLFTKYHSQLLDPVDVISGLEQFVHIVSLLCLCKYSLAILFHLFFCIIASLVEFQLLLYCSRLLLIFIYTVIASRDQMRMLADQT